MSAEECRQDSDIGERPKEELLVWETHNGIRNNAPQHRPTAVVGNATTETSVRTLIELTARCA